jgi:hypothetical protein
MDAFIAMDVGVEPQDYGSPTGEATARGRSDPDWTASQPMGGAARRRPPTWDNTRFVRRGREDPVTGVGLPLELGGNTWAHQCQRSLRSSCVP